MDTNNFKKILPTYFLLIILPSFFGLFLYFYILNIDKKHDIEVIKSELSERAADFMIKTTPLEYFKSYFDELSNKLSPFIENEKGIDGYLMTKRDVSDEIKKYRNKLNHITFRFACAIFDSEGKLQNPEDLEDYESRFFTYTWNMYLSDKDIDYPNRLVDQNKIVGREFKNDFIKDKKENCISTFSVGKTGVLYGKRGNKQKNGIIIFVEHPNTGLAITDITIAKSRVIDLSTFEHPIIFYNLETKKRETSTLGFKDIPFEKTLTNDFLNGFVDDNVVWLGVNSDYYRILLGQRIINYFNYNKRFYISISIFLLILISSSFFFFKNLSNFKGIYISIKYKLIFLFALAVYMPTLSLWVLSLTSLEDHRTAIENNIKRGMLDTCNKIDSNFKKKLKEILRHYTLLDDYLKSFKGKQAPTSDEIDSKLKEIVGKGHKRIESFNWLDIRHINQTQLYTTQDDEGNQRLEKVFRAISMLCLDRYCPEKLTKAGIKPSQSDILVGNVFENPMVGFSTIFERPRQLNFSNFEGANIYWWWNYYPDLDNSIAFCIGTSNLKHSTISYFNSLAKERYYFDNTSLKVINFQYSYQEFVPEISKRNEKDLLNLINVSNLNKTIETAIIDYDNEKKLCLCFPGSVLKECFTICMYPIHEIDYKIEMIRSTIFKVMILILVISILTGLLLARIFIIPVNELNRGLTALENRKTDTLINIENNDELGRLGTTFNQMMLDIKDMLLAGAVQQCLIPSGNYLIEGYDCLIYNQMAVDVGGDYADIFELPNNKILIVIGDVTGHGIASALLTAMVKASIYNFAKENIELNEIVINTSNMICDLLKQKKLMTFCAISLDKDTGEMAICNAGHPYPIIKEKEIGIIRTPCKTSVPMGLSKKRCRYTSEAEVLKPEETLFVYTDGFPEAENDKGEEYGYDNFNNLIANSIINNSQEFCENLLKEFKKHHGEKELADDVTFIILRRKSL